MGKNAQDILKARNAEGAKLAAQHEAAKHSDEYGGKLPRGVREDRSPKNFSEMNVLGAGDSGKGSLGLTERNARTAKRLKRAK